LLREFGVIVGPEQQRTAPNRVGDGAEEGHHGLNREELKTMSSVRCIHEATRKPPSAVAIRAKRIASPGMGCRSLCVGHWEFYGVVCGRVYEHIISINFARQRRPHRKVSPQTKAVVDNGGSGFQGGLVEVRLAVSEPIIDGEGDFLERL